MARPTDPQVEVLAHRYRIADCDLALLSIGVALNFAQRRWLYPSQSICSLRSIVSLNAPAAPERGSLGTSPSGFSFRFPILNFEKEPRWTSRSVPHEAALPNYN